MRFRILGPVEAWADGGEPVRLPPKPQALLAVLLVHAGRPVSRDRLMAAVWPEEAPPSAPRVIRTYVSALRRSLRVPCQGGLPRLAALGDAYCLEVAPGDLDMLVFDDLAERGRRALGDGDAAAAARLLDQALALWRGPPAGNVTVDTDTSAVLAGLAERRLLAEEDRADAELVLGRDAALIARLRLLVAPCPLRERLWRQLMTALYRTGQRAAALACYRQLRTHLVAELGVEPGPELGELHQQILAGDSLPARQPAAMVPVAQAMPRQLPPDVSHFTGRAAELDRLDALLGTSGAGMPATVVVTAINGTPGVGKTALAIRCAHRMASRFPDGQLYASLRGHAADAAGRLLAPGRRHVPLDPPPPECRPLTLADYEQALEWCDAEHAGVVACVRSAAQTGHDDIAWQLPVASFGYFDLRKPWAEWIACARIALSAARRCGDRFGQAWTLGNLGVAYIGLGRFGDALDCGRQSLRIRRDIGDRRGEGAELNNLGHAYLALDRFRDGLNCFEQALAIAREIENRHGAVIGLSNLGETCLKLGRSGDAISFLQEALDLAREMDYRVIEGVALHNLGESYRAIGEPGTSADCFRRALSVRQHAGDRHGQARTLHALGDLLQELREADAAHASWQQALAILEELGDPQADELRARLRTSGHTKCRLPVRLDDLEFR